MLARPCVEVLDELDLSPYETAVVRALCLRLGASTLLQALNAPDADRRLAGLVRRGNTTALVDSLTSAIEDLAGEQEGFDEGEVATKDALVRPTVETGPIPEPPKAVADVRRWAERYGVSERLADPVSVLGSVYSSNLFMTHELSRRATVGALLEPGDGSGRRSAPRWEVRAREQAAEHLALLARRYLHGLAIARAAILAQRAAVERRARAPEEPALAAAFARVEALREELGRTVVARPIGIYTPLPLLVAEAPPRIVYREAIGYQSPSQIAVTILVEEDPLGVECSCTGAPGARCGHALAALDAARDALRDPESPHRKELGEMLRVPAWERCLTAFDAEISRRALPEPAVDEQVAWKIIAHGESMTVEARVQRRLKKGGFSVGQRASIENLLTRRDLLADPRDMRVAEAVADLPTDRWVPPNKSALLRVLNALVDHPRVLIEGGSVTPGRVTRERLTVVVDLDGEVARVAFRLGQLDLKGEMLRQIAGGRAQIVHDVARSVVMICDVDEHARALLTAMQRHPARFPPESHERLLTGLSRLQDSVDLALAEALVGEPIEPDSRPVLRLSPTEAFAVDVEVRVRPIEGGPDFPPGEGPETVLSTRDGKRVVARREHEREVARATAILDRLVPTRDPGFQFSLEIEPALDLIGALPQIGDEAVVEWPEPDKRVALAPLVSRRELRIRVTDRRDWFGVEGAVEVDGDSIPFTELLEAVRRGRRYVRVGPGRFAAIEEDLRRRVAALDDVIHTGRHGLEVGLPGAAQLAELLDEGAHLQAAARFRRIVDRIDAARALDPELPEGLTATLRPYQIEGYKWLSRLASWGMGACLADDMGLGKTLQALALLLARKDGGPALVIAPTSVGPNWIEEAQRFAPGLRAVLYRGPDRASLLASAGPGDLLVTSYALAVRDAEALAKARLSTLVLDEAQAIKNALTRRARAVRDLDAELTIALTGTPVENHLGELWSVMRIVTPGLLGSWETFRDRFAGPIERSHDAGRSAALARVVRPFLLRRTKAEVAPELPPRVEIQRFVDLSAAEKRLYDVARRDALESIATATGDARFVLLAALTRLRRLACHPRLLDDRSRVPSSKLAALIEVVHELREEGHRALVFSQFTTHLALVREALDRESIAYEYLDGSTPSEERTRRIASFQRGSAELFLISLKAGGTGLNLTAADYVIHLDPWWNPAVEDQATDRAHRIGQTRAVTVIRLVSRGTIEEAVLALHGDKRALAASVFDEEGGAARLTTEEMAALVRAGANAAITDEESDAAGDEVTEDPDSKRSLPPPSANAKALPPASAAPPSAAAPSSIEALPRAVIDHLAAEREIAEPRYHATMRLYERHVRRFADYLGSPEHNPEGAPPSEPMIDAYLAAIDRGAWPLPPSQRSQTRTVMGHVRAFLRAQPPR